jgi:hypothetical protein
MSFNGAPREISLIHCQTTEQARGNAPGQSPGSGLPGVRVV